MTDEQGTPIITTQVKLAAIETPEGGVIIVFPQIVVEGSFALDRSQALALGAELLKHARSLPSSKELERVARKLILPS